MDSKKYEQLINFIINEDEDKAKELFHEIVVEQSRGIYESIMAEEMMGVDEEEHMGGEVGDLLDEITAEESGVSEDEEVEMDSEQEEDFGGEESEEIFDLEADSEEDDSSEEVEDAVVRIEDKLDELMGEFEEILGKMDDEGEGKEEVEVDSEETEEINESMIFQKRKLKRKIIESLEDSGEIDPQKLAELLDGMARHLVNDDADTAIENLDQMLDSNQEKAEFLQMIIPHIDVSPKSEQKLLAKVKEYQEDQMMQEAIQLQKVSPHHGDDGDQKQSPVAANSGKEGMDSDPVDYSGGGDEKGRPAPQAKDVKDASSFKNAPAGKAKVDLSSAPKPVTKDGAQNDKSPYAK